MDRYSLPSYQNASNSRRSPAGAQHQTSTPPHQPYAQQQQQQQPSQLPPLRRPALAPVSQSEHNKSTFAAIRIVPKTPPQLLGPGQAQQLASASGAGVPLPSDSQKYTRGPARINAIPHPHPSNFRAPNVPTSSGHDDSNVLSPHTGLQYAHDPWTPAFTAPAGAVSPGSLSPSSSTASRPKPPLPRKRLHIHDDNKTFSLLFDSEETTTTTTSGSKSPTLSYSSTKASSYLPSSDAFSLSNNAQGWTNLKASCIPARDLAGSTFLDPTTPKTKDQVPISADPISNSPWNYQFIGGLRKVAKTPDLKQKASKPTGRESPLPPLPSLATRSEVSHDLARKHSFDSIETEKTNYEIYRNDSASPQSSLLQTRSSDSDYQDPPSSVFYRPQTAESEDNENYEIHDHSSPPTAAYQDLVVHPKFSQESLIVPPLKPKVRRPSNTSSTYNSRSRDPIRSPSLTSLSTIFSHKEALRAIVGSGSLVQLPIPLPKVRVPAPSTSSWVEPPVLYPPRSHMNETPHQWSSQLSTVLSVSDGESLRDSRSWADDDGRSSLQFGSRSSTRQGQGRVVSVGSEQDLVSPLSRTASSRGPFSSSEDSYRAASRDSLPYGGYGAQSRGWLPEQPPQPYFARPPRHPSSPSVRLVQDLDEHGDGITDMQSAYDLRARPSRRKLSGVFNSSSSENGRTSTMRSSRSAATTTTRSNSLLANSIPAWAKLYYGSGERRYLGRPGSSATSAESQYRAYSFRSGSPNTDNFPANIYSPRRRPREVQPNRQGQRRGSLEINPAPELYGEDGRLRNDPYTGRRYRTFSMSSLWSPHLRHDRRAHRPHVLEPPSVNWSTESGVFGRRNIQVVMFIVGFIFPFAWMIASFLPLPPIPIQEIRELDHSAANLDARNTGPNHYTRQMGPMDEARYESAVWWRKLNRWMSFVGVLIIASVIVLVVIGVKQNWGLPRTETF